MLEPIEELFRKEVRPFTNGILRLHNNSRPVPYKTEKEFLDAYTKNGYVQTPGYVSRGFMDINFIMHLNPSGPEWHRLIMAYFQPKAFFIERSELGKSLAKSGVDIDIINDDKYFFLDGIGRWVEIKIIDRIKDSDRKLSSIKKELIEDIKSIPCYQALQMCDYFWDAAQKADLSNLLGTKEPEPGEIIAAGILAASRLAMTEEDLYGNFNDAFSKLEDIAFRTKGKSIVDIYHIGGMYKKKQKIVIPSEDIKYLESTAKDLGFLMATDKQVSEIGIVLGKTKKELSEINKQYGQNPFTRFAELSSGIYGRVEEAVAKDPGKTLSEIGAEGPVLKRMLTDFLINYSNQLSEYWKEINGS